MMAMKIMTAATATVATSGDIDDGQNDTEEYNQDKNGKRVTSSGGQL